MKVKQSQDSEGNSSKPWGRLQAGSPGLSLPIDPHVVGGWEDKGCKAISKGAHDGVDGVCR